MLRQIVEWWFLTVSKPGIKWKRETLRPFNKRILFQVKFDLPCQGPGKNDHSSTYFLRWSTETVAQNWVHHGTCTSVFPPMEPSKMEPAPLDVHEYKWIWEYGIVLLNMVGMMLIWACPKNRIPLQPSCHLNCEEIHHFETNPYIDGRFYVIGHIPMLQCFSIRFISILGCKRTNQFLRNGTVSSWWDAREISSGGIWRRRRRRAVGTGADFYRCKQGKMKISWNGGIPKWMVS